jgi:hypothetical protein
LNLRIGYTGTRNLTYFNLNDSSVITTCDNILYINGLNDEVNSIEYENSSTGYLQMRCDKRKNKVQIILFNDQTTGVECFYLFIENNIGCSSDYFLHEQDVSKEILTSTLVSIIMCALIVILAIVGCMIYFCTKKREQPYIRIGN